MGSFAQGGYITVGDKTQIPTPKDNGEEAVIFINDEDQELHAIYSTGDEYRLVSYGAGNRLRFEKVV